MKKILSVLMIIFIFLILVTLLFGCAGGLTQTQVEQKYGPPAKKEETEDKVIYYYYFEGRRLRIPHERYKSTWEFTFDKVGNHINQRKYFSQPTIEGVKP